MTLLVQKIMKAFSPYALVFSFGFGLFFFLGETALANHNPRHFVAVSPEEIQVKDLCPIKMVCFTDGIQIDLQYSLPCDRDITDFQFDITDGSDEVNVYISAISAPVEAGAKPNCSESHTVYRSIHLPSVFGNVVVHSMDI